VPGRDSRTDGASQWHPSDTLFHGECEHGAWTRSRPRRSVSSASAGGEPCRRPPSATSAGRSRPGPDGDSDVRAEFEAAFDAPAVEQYGALPYGDLDGVVVGTPNAFHAPAAIHALERDVAVYVAKPIADSPDAAEGMLAAARASEAWGIVGFVARFDPGVDRFRAHHDRGRFSDVSHVEIEQLRRRGIPGVGPWFCDAELAGGGSLYDIGVHAIDRALYALDFPEPIEVSGVARTEFGDREDYADPDGFGGNWDGEGAAFTVDDSASAFVRFVDGTTMTVETSWAANRPPSNTTVFQGTEAGAVLGGDRNGDLEINAADRAGTDHYLDTTLSGDREHTGTRARSRSSSRRSAPATPPTPARSRRAC